MKTIKYLILASFLLVLAGCSVFKSKPSNINSEPTTGPASQTTVEAPQPVLLQVKELVKTTVDSGIEAVEEKAAELKTPVVNSALPATFDQVMAFSRQAPFGNWDAVHEEACEEASLIMANNFFRGKPLDEKIMDEEINKLLPWEEKRFGFVLSTTIEETAVMAREYFGLQTEVTSEVTVDQIKKELVAGKLIILPLAGRELHNPNYTGVGPLYHMLVVRGYDRDQFITNDPGTRLGQGYKYKYDLLLGAVHDWNGGDVYNGAKKMLVVSLVKK